MNDKIVQICIRSSDDEKKALADAQADEGQIDVFNWNIQWLLFISMVSFNEPSTFAFTSIERSRHYDSVFFIKLFLRVFHLHFFSTIKIYFSRGNSLFPTEKSITITAFDLIINKCENGETKMRNSNFEKWKNEFTKEEEGEREKTERNVIYLIWLK